MIIRFTASIRSFPSNQQSVLAEYDDDYWNNLSDEQKLDHAIQYALDGDKPLVLLEYEDAETEEPES